MSGKQEEKRKPGGLLWLECKKVLKDRRFLGVWVLLLAVHLFLTIWNEMPGNDYTHTPAEYEALYQELKVLTPQEAVDELTRRIDEIEAARWAEFMMYMDSEIDGETEEKAEENESKDKETEERETEVSLKVRRVRAMIDRVLPAHPYAAENLIRQVRDEIWAVAGRNEMLVQTVRRAEQMQGLSLFQGALSEAELGNLKKTGADFAKAPSTPLEQVSAEQGIRMVFEDPTADIFMLLLLFLAMHFMVAAGYQNGMETLVLSCKKGRGRVTLVRVAALFLVTGLVWASFFLVRSAASAVLYSWGDLSRPIQAISSYIKCLFRLSVAEMLAVHFLWKWLWFFLFIVVQMALMKALRKEILADGLLLGVWGLGLFFWKQIAENSIYRIGKYINVYYLLRPDQIWAGYNNIRVGTWWISGWLFAAAATAILLTGSLWALWKLRRRILLKRRTWNFTRKRSGPSFKGLLTAEYRKAFRILPIGLVFLALFALQWERSRDDLLWLGSEEMACRSYQIQWQRELTGSDAELEALIRAEEKELERAFKGESEKYSEQMAEVLSRGLSEASWRYRDAVQTARKRGEAVLYFFDKAYDLLVNEPATDIRHGAEASLLVLLLMVCLTGYEHVSGMRRMLKTTSRGEARYYRNKLLVLSTFVLLTMALVYGPDIRLVGKTYGYDTLAASVGSLSCARDFPLPVSVGGYLVILYIWRFLMLMLVGIAALLVTEWTKNGAVSALICLVFVWLPYLLYYLGVDWASGFGMTPFLGGNGWLQSWGR